MSELIQTAAVAVVAFLVLTLLALFLKAEAATWNPKTEDKQP